MEVWRCPWSGEVAKHETTPAPSSESRTCDCGAVGLTAAIHDSDEIIDDAIRLFGVRTREASKGFSDLLLADVAQAGVEVRGGAVAGMQGGLPARRWIWFRRTERARD
jgi:hypothetical protein